VLYISILVTVDASDVVSHIVKFTGACIMITHNLLCICIVCACVQIIYAIPTLFLFWESFTAFSMVNVCCNQSILFHRHFSDVSFTCNTWSAELPALLVVTVVWIFVFFVNVKYHWIF